MDRAPPPPSPHGTGRDGPLPRGAAVIVIGAGVTGLSAAWWLARSGVEVLVLDRGLVGFEASGRNGGGCTHYTSALFAEEQRLWPLMDGLLGYPTEYRRDRIIVATRPGDLALYHAMTATIGGLGFGWEALDGDEVRRRVPLAGATALGGVHLKVGGHANPQRMVQAYAWAVEDLGGRIRQHCPVRRLVLQAGRVIGVETAEGLLGCDHVVLAAGPGTGVLAATAGIRLPLRAARAEMIVTEPLPPMPLGGVDGNGLYGRQTLRGNLAYGGGPHEWVALPPGDGPPARPVTPVSAHLARRLVELFPKAAHARVIRSWAGIVENTPDGRPVIDRPARPGNLTLCTMSSVGFGLSPASGRAIRDLVLDGACGFADISKYGLARFDGLAADWAEARGWDAPAVPPA